VTKEVAVDELKQILAFAVLIHFGFQFIKMIVWKEYCFWDWGMMFISFFVAAALGYII